MECSRGQSFVEHQFRDRLSVRALGTQLLYLAQPQSKGGLISPIFQMGKLSLRKVRKLAQDPVAQILLITKSFTRTCLLCTLSGEQSHTSGTVPPLCSLLHPLFHSSSRPIALPVLCHSFRNVKTARAKQPGPPV